MDIYHLSFDLKPGTSDVGFADALDAWLGHLKSEGKIESWRLTRRKLGFGPFEFHLMIETTGLAQLDEAFSIASMRSGEAESLHAAVNQKIAKIEFALTRDFPDENRQRGDEKF